MIRRALPLLMLPGLLLAACDVNSLSEQALRRAAASVVQPVMNVDMPGDVAAKATTCVLDNASDAEIEALARDVGVEAGTLTVANIRKIAERPATQACFVGNGVPPLKV